MASLGQEDAFAVEIHLGDLDLNLIGELAKDEFCIDTA